MPGYLTAGDRDRIDYYNQKAKQADGYAAAHRQAGRTNKADTCAADAKRWRAAADAVRPLNI